MPTSISPTAALLFLTTLLPLTSAQNSTNSSSPSSCPSSSFDIPSGATVNATGSTSWHWDSASNPDAYADPWYLSVLLNDTARGESTSSFFAGIKMFAYLSVPPSTPNDTQVCAYQFGSLNATLEENQDGEHSCKGVVSDECIKYLNENWNSKGVGRCPGFSDGTNDGVKEWHEKCPMLSASGTATNDLKFNNATNTTCTYPSLPSVDIPKDYITHGLPSAFSPFKDYFSGDNATQAYDLMTRQVVPYVFIARLAVPPSNSEQMLTRAVCVVPGKAVEGSRAVDGKKPWDSGAGKVRGSSVLGVVAALAAGLVL